MRSPGNHIVKLLTLSILTLLVGAASIVSNGVQVYATDTIVQAALNGSPAPDLQITLASPVTVANMPLLVTGTISNLNQIQVYVDGNYSSMIPLTPATTTFSYSLNLNSGTHTVQFIGISAYTSTNPSVTISVIYTPPVTPPAGGSSGTPSGGGSGSNGVTIGGAAVSDLQTPNLLTIPMPDWMYKTLVFFDIINPNKPSDTSTMFGRFLLLMIGLFFVVFARLVLASYRKIRYDWLRWNKRPLTYILRRAPLFWIRLIGLVIIVYVFLFL